MTRLQSRWRHFIAECLALITWEGLKNGVYAFLLLAIPVASSFFSSKIRKLVVEFTLAHGYGIAAGGIVGLVLAIPMLAAHRTIRYYPPLKKQDLDFKQVKRELGFQYREDRKTLVYCRAITLKPLRPGLTAYRNKFMWTGKTPPQITNNIRRHSFKLLERKSVWQYYEISFGRALNVSDTESTSLTFTIDDPEHTFTPFISATIDEPTDELVMKLHIPPEFGITEATTEVSYNMGANVPCSTEIRNLDSDGGLTWSISKPLMHQYYELRWQKPEVYEIPGGRK